MIRFQEKSKTPNYGLIWAKIMMGVFFIKKWATLFLRVCSKIIKLIVVYSFVSYKK